MPSMFYWDNYYSFILLFTSLLFKDFRMLYIIRKGFYRWIFCYKSYQVTSLESLDIAPLKLGTTGWQVGDGSESVKKARQLTSAVTILGNSVGRASAFGTGGRAFDQDIPVFKNGTTYRCSLVYSQTYQVELGQPTLPARATENRFFAGSDRFIVCKTDSVCIKRIFFGPKKHT